ncbi:methyl-accepting chemotaxis protein [Paenibacillus tarimensis]
MRYSLRLSLGSKLNLFFLVIILFLTSVIWFVVQSQLENGIKAQALEKAKSDLALGFSYLNEKYPGEWTIRDGFLYKGETKINDNFEIVDEIGQLTGGDTVTIFQGDTRVTTNVMKDGKRAVGTQVSEQVANVVLKQGEIFLGEANVVGQFYQTAYQPLKNAGGEIIGIWYVGASQSMIDSVQASFMRIFCAVLGTAVLLSLLFVILFNRRLKRRLAAISFALTKAGSGDFSYRIQDITHDEIGEISTGYNQMCSCLCELIEQVAQSAREVAMSAENLSSGSYQINQATEHISENIAEVAEGADKQVQSVDYSLQSVHKISANARHIAANAQDVSAVAAAAAGKTAEGTALIENSVQQMSLIHETMNQLSRVVEGLGQRSQEIEQIIEVITGIADQTNLLALNAAIEAARAGEEGRGFAVVAGEVRKLAEQSAQSAGQVSRLIDAIRQETDIAVETMAAGSNEVTQGIQVVNDAGSSFEQIRQSIREVANKIEEVSASAQQMSVGAEQVVQVISSIAEVAGSSAMKTQNVSAASEEQLASMEEITSAAATLLQMSEQLQKLTGKFKIN